MFTYAKSKAQKAQRGNMNAQSTQQAKLNLHRLSSSWQVIKTASRLGLIEVMAPSDVYLCWHIDLQC